MHIFIIGIVCLDLKDTLREASAQCVGKDMKRFWWLMVGNKKKNRCNKEIRAMSLELIQKKLQRNSSSSNSKCLNFLGKAILIKNEFLILFKLMYKVVIY